MKIEVDLVNTKGEFDYKNTETYIKKQQDIDMLLVLGKLLEPGINVTNDNVNKINTRIYKILDSLQ